MFSYCHRKNVPFFNTDIWHENTFNVTLKTNGAFSCPVYISCSYRPESGPSNEIFQVLCICIKYSHSYKKKKDSVEDSLVQVLLTTKLELSKILVPRPPQNVSNVNIEGTRKGKRMYYLCDQLLGAQVYIHFIVLVLICFYLIMRGVNYAINRRLKQEEKYCCGYYSR